MLLNIVKWIRSHKITIIVALSLLIIDVFLAFLDNWKIKDNYIPGIITEIIGIIITVAFVDLFFNQNNEKMEKDLERKKIIRICRIINSYLSRYIIHFNQLTNHPSDIFDCKITELGNAQGILVHIGSQCSSIMNTNQNLFTRTEIEINYVNFSNLYDDSKLFISGEFRSNIDCFYYYEKKLFDGFTRLLTEVNFNYYKDFGELVENFIETSITNDISDYIEYNRKIAYSGDDKKRTLKITNDASILVSRSFNEKQDWSNHHNNLFPYKMLKDLLNAERKLLNKYIVLLKNLDI